MLLLRSFVVWFAAQYSLPKNNNGGVQTTFGLSSTTHADADSTFQDEDIKAPHPSISPLFSSTEILPPFDASLYKAGATVRRYPGGSILIDVENVRGKSGFSLSHAELIQGLVRWSRVCELQGRLSLVIDHGSEVTGLYMEDAAMAVLFAGPKQKADDVIAHDVRFLGQELDVTVVTADGGIMDRCRRSAIKQGVHIVSPLHLLQDLELIAERTRIVETKPVLESDSNRNETSDDETAQSLKLAENLEYEIRIGAELLEAEALLRSKSSIKNRKRKAKLQAKIRKLREKLANTPPVLQCITDVLTHGKQASSLVSLSTEDQDRLLQRWEKIRMRSNRKEKTGDRTVLAEHLRRQLVDIYGDGSRTLNNLNATESSPNIAMAHVRKV
jgi:hypothetical protein